MKTLTLSIGLLLATMGLSAQYNALEPSISPLVQRSNFAGTHIPAPKALQVKVQPKRWDSYPLRNLRSWAKLALDAKASDMTITLGIKGDKLVRSVEKDIPTKSEAYYLQISDKGIVVAGADERGLFYGLQTLRQMMADGKLAVGTITDYPDVRYRGVVEGFYGTPWSYEDRLSQLDFYGRHKLNVYIYGPKDDPYHSVPSWRKPYPEQEAKQIQSLVERARDNGVIFYWAIHPGQDIKWNEEDRDLLLAKFEKMYELGVRGFAVFFDDISGEGTRADKQAELLNYIDDNFIKVKKDVAPLVMCPTEYNRSWSKIEGGYLPTLGDKLNEGIEIMWTGNTVVACLDKPDVEWINKHIKRKAYIWFNFPVSDFVRDHLLLGETYGNSLDIAPDLSGFLSNPMEHAESSKIALYSVADYTWNMKQYNAHQSWLRSMEAVLPEAPEALRIFAEHSSALGANGHRFEREESVLLQPTLRRMSEGKATAEDIALIDKTCRDVQQAANVLLASQSNPNMLDEMKPWLQMAKLVGEYGTRVLALSTALEQARFIKDYNEIRSLQRLMYILDTEANQNPYQPGVKYGSAHLLPALNAHFAETVATYNKANATALSAETVYKPFDLSSTVALLSNQPISTRGKQVMVSASNEVIKWQANEGITLMAKQIQELQDLSLDLGVKDVTDKVKLEILVEGKWTNIALHQNTGDTAFRPKQSLAGIKLTGIRLTYVGSEPQDFRLRTFRFVLR